MPFTEDQFERFLKALDTRELLIRIDENTKHFRKDYEEHVKENHEKFGQQKLSIDSAHKRLDNQLNEMTKFRGVVIGVGSFATIVISLVQVYIAYIQ